MYSDLKMDEWDIIPRMAMRNLASNWHKDIMNVEDVLNRPFNTAMELNSLLPNIMDMLKHPHYYGYQITIGTDGKPHIREFGNIKPSKRGLLEQSNIREPLVDTSLDEKTNTILVTAEMPGVSKEDIKLSLSDNYITIHADRGNKKYHTQIPLAIDIDETSTKATYANGILELRIKLKAKSKGKEIKIE